MGGRMTTFCRWVRVVLPSTRCGVVSCGWLFYWQTSESEAAMVEDVWVDTSTVSHVSEWADVRGESAISGGVRVGEDSLHWTHCGWRTFNDVSAIRLHGVTARGGMAHGVGGCDGLGEGVLWQAVAGW